MTTRQRQAIERHQRHEHARTCTGLKLTACMTTVGGQTLRIISGAPCPHCLKGKWLAERPEALEQAIERAARRRGPTWITAAEFAAQHFNASGIPLWGGIRVDP